MYPDKILGILTLYDILISLGIVLGIVVFGYLADKRRVSGKLQKFTLLCALAAIAVGLGSSVLFQAVYNIESMGGFTVKGSTFYGGLIGGFTVFLILYFVIGHFLYRKTDEPKYHAKSFFTVISCAAPSIALAHGFGRFGCLTAGCCHGAVTDAWYGIMMHGGEGYAKYVPTQLFEALFLFALFALLFFNVKLKGRFNLSLYMGLYGVWRFVLEFVRNDYRGSIGLNITPSQLISLIMILGAILVLVAEILISKRIGKVPETPPTEPSKEENN